MTERLTIYRGKNQKVTLGHHRKNDEVVITKVCIEANVETTLLTEIMYDLIPTNGYVVLPPELMKYRSSFCFSASDWYQFDAENPARINYTVPQD